MSVYWVLYTVEGVGSLIRRLTSTLNGEFNGSQQHTWVNFDSNCPYYVYDLTKATAGLS